MEKYKEIKKKYNSDKTFVQISKELHNKVKEHCKSNNIKVKDFLEEIIKKYV
jgi:predicted HicB family RNase H-like nuclease